MTAMLLKSLTNCFSNIVKNLNILPKDDVISDNVNDPDLINRAILKYEHHLSILKIKETFGNNDTFSFVHCSYRCASRDSVLEYLKSPYDEYSAKNN